MKRKQLIAFFMAGALAVGTVPAAVSAADSTDVFSADETADSTSEQTAAETEAQEQTETPAAETTAAAEQPAAETTAAPVTETVAAETTSEPTTEAEPATEATTETEPVTEAEETETTTGLSVDPVASNEGNVVYMKINGETVYYSSFTQAIVNAEGSTLENPAIIYITDDIVLDYGIDIGDKHIILTGAKKDDSGNAATAVISRGEKCTGDLFTISGSGSLQFEGGVSSSAVYPLVIDGNGTAVQAIGAVVNVSSEEGAFALLEGATIQNNITSGKGSAINNEAGGTVQLKGGVITGNQTTDAGGGAIYSRDASLYIGDFSSDSEAAAVTVSGNVGADGITPANIVLTGTDSSLKLGAVADGSVICVTSAEVQQLVSNVAIDENGVETVEEGDTSSFQYISYDGTDKTYNPADGTLTGGTDSSTEATTQETSSETTTTQDSSSETSTQETSTEATTESSTTDTTQAEATPTPTPTVVTPTPTVVTPTPTTAADKKLNLSSKKAISWTSHTSASFAFSATKNGYYYVTWTTDNIRDSDGKIDASLLPAFDLDYCTSSMAADTTETVTLSDIDAESGNNVSVIVYAVDEAKKVKSTLVYTLKDSSRPADTSTETRDPITPSVSESTVTGLESALEFYPNTFYKFTVTGAGTKSTDKQVTDPVAGDVQWRPVYWSTSSNPSSSQKNTSWQIGAKAGITQEKTFTMYVFFQKYVYSGTEWQSTDTIEYISVPFYSKAITIVSSTPVPTDSEYYNTDGTDTSEDDSTDASSHSDDSTDTGSSSSATGAQTADNSPIGTMSMLAMLSMLTGGYVLVRRRKRED